MPKEDYVIQRYSQSCAQCTDRQKIAFFVPRFTRKPKRKQLDAMSVVTRKGKPHLMITMTCNSNWPEIQDNLLSGQNALDRPDLCNRVIKIKLKELMIDLTRNLFGKAEYYLTVIEFQKKG